MDINKSRELLQSEKAKNLFTKLYGKQNIDFQRDRYISVINGFADNFKETDVLLFSSPGRSEISGNHTDHNHGKVLGASINLDCVAVAAKTNSNSINVISETFNQKFTIDLDDLKPSDKKAGTIDLVKGLLKGFIDKGYKIGGFNTYITSNVIASAGVSSSAAFETLICQIINTLFNEGKIDVVTYAHISKFAENVYWDKQSGLLDQMCCAYGGLINIDFFNPNEPKIKKVNFDFGSTDYSLIIVQTGRGHADLSADYSSIPAEMKAVAAYFKKDVLAEIDEKDFYKHINDIRTKTGDRAIMRAIHFFDENKRVEQIVKACESGDFDTFFNLVHESGNSSWKYLQNCYTNAAPEEQGITLTLALTEKFIKENKAGTCRVHGGGFAGVIMAILPNTLVSSYVTTIEKLQGEGAAHIMSIRPLGSICINKYLV